MRASLVFLVSTFLTGLALAEESKTSVEDFRLALPGYQYSFPKDHWAHPEFRTEWWYFTGHLTKANQNETIPFLGYELTFFRTALKAEPVTAHSEWSLRDIYFAHFAISDLQKKVFWFFEKINRGAFGLAGAEKTKLKTWVEDWTLEEKDHHWHLQAKAQDHSVDFQLDPMKPEVIHGINGVSQKAEGPGKSTHYVSFTRLKTLGTVTLANHVSSVVGESWYDHEFGSNQLTSDQAGWDWFSLQLDNHEEVMIYLLRKKNGCFETASSGTWIDSKGKSVHLGLADISVLSTATWKSNESGITYPARWEIRVPKKSLNVVVEPLLADQELRVKETANTSYWEGACKVSGSHSGKAYVELTGYTKNSK